MTSKVSFLAVIIITAATAGSLYAQRSTAPVPAQATVSLDQILDKIIEHEALFGEKLTQLHPLIETYIQNLDRSEELAFAPKSDAYFLGKLDLTGNKKQQSLLEGPGIARAMMKKLGTFSSIRYMPDGFAQMLVLGKGFNRDNYTFEYVRREFLGEVRCLVFDVQPKRRAKGTFSGRIWVEDRDYNIVRFNGINGSSSMTKIFFHFDSWRENIGPGLWMPSYVYSEESDRGYFFGRRKLRFKAQTRVWGYNVEGSRKQDELTALTVESDQVRDNINGTEDTSPVRAFRAWELQAEDNIIQRLEKAALMAPSGEVNKVLETVISNLVVTNNLESYPEVRARVLLTSPLESFTIGNTIVLSRGMIDVLPDEASLAMILAHELAHIALGHGIDTKYAFNDRMFFEDEDAFTVVRLKRNDNEETEADKLAAEYLNNSPYKDKLGNAGLFLRAVNERAGKLTHLLLPHIGNTMVKDSAVTRMANLMQSAPQLEMKKLDQIAALPLGGRVRVDAWTGRVELAKATPVPLQFAREKMPLEVTPVFLYLSRRTNKEPAATQTTSTKQDN